MPRKQSLTTLKFQFKPVPVPEDILTAPPTWPYVCVPIPIPLIPYLTPIMRIWQSPGCLSGTPEQIVEFIILWTKLIADINAAGPCQDGLMLRQNPTNSCQLQQSLDGGVTWLLAFDYSLCRNPGIDILIEQNFNQTFQVWSETLTLTEININAPLVTFTSSAGETQTRLNARHLALCYATRQYVDTYCEIIREINQDASGLANLIFLAQGVVVALGTAGAIVSFGTSTLLALGISAAVGALGVAVYNSLTEAVLDDLEAREAVACLMYKNLRNAAPTPANFAASVNGGALSGNAELIRSTLANDISNVAGLDNQFNAFMNMLGEALRPAELGLIEDCPCHDVTVQIFSDFNRTALKETRQVFYGEPFDIEIDTADWGTNEFFAVWNVELDYAYTVETGVYTGTTTEFPFAYIEGNDTIVTGAAPAAATDLATPGTAKGIFMNAAEGDNSTHIVRITLDLP